MCCIVQARQTDHWPPPCFPAPAPPPPHALSWYGTNPHSVYKSTRKLYAEADSQGMRVYHDELLHGDVRLVMLVPAWFPRAHVAFDWARVQGSHLSVIFVLRGTMQVGAGPPRVVQLPGSGSGQE